MHQFTESSEKKMLFMGEKRSTILWNFVKIELVLQMYDIMSLKGVGENWAGPSNFGKQYFAWKCKMKTQRAEHKHCSVIDKFVSHGNIV